MGNRNPRVVSGSGVGNNNIYIGVAPDDINAITKDSVIPYVVIMSDAPLQHYFGDGNSANYKTWPADTPLPVHPDLRLSNDTTCWTYGERDV